MTPRSTARAGLIVLVVLVLVAVLVLPGRFGSGVRPGEAAAGDPTTSSAIAGPSDPTPPTADPAVVPVAQQRTTSTGGGGVTVDPEVEQAVADDGRAPVILQLDVATAGSPDDQAAAVAAAAERVLAGLPDGSYTAVKPTGPIPALALTVDGAGLAALRDAGAVVRVGHDRVNQVTSTGSTTSMGAPPAWALGLDGSGRTVAVLDTGVDAAHPYLQDGASSGVIAEACFSSSSPSVVSSNCPNGLTSQVGTGAAAPCTAVSTCQHGTHVAGIAAGGTGASSLASSTYQASGMAPGANIVAVQVFSEGLTTGVCGSTAPCIVAYDSDIINALQWLYQQKSTSFPGLSAVNLSLGGGKYAPNTTCDSDNAVMKQAIDALRGVGIATVIASGNSGYRGYTSSPGCISSAVEVGSASDLTLGVSSFSNISTDVDLLAAGESIRSSLPGGVMGSMSGTSMATPAVTGAIAVLKEAQPALSVSDAVALLRGSGPNIVTQVAGLSIPYVNLGAAIAPPPPSSLQAVAGVGSATVNWSPPSPAPVLPVTSYTATVSPGTGSCTTTTTTTCTVTGLAPGTPVAFTVTATNTAGTSPVATSAAVVPTGVPGAPQAVSAFGANGSAWVTWQAPASNGGTAITGYTVTASPGGGTCTAATAVGCRVPSLTNGTPYTFTATATNGVGTGPSSASSAAVSPAPSALVPLVPARLLDTRSVPGVATVDGQGLGGGPVSSAQPTTVKVTGRGGVPASGVGAVALNVTAVGPSAGGYLTVYPAGQPAPLASNLNFVAGQTVPNMVIAQVGTNGQVALAAAGGPVDVIVDVLGWFPTGAGYQGLVPARLSDTRSGPGISTVDGQYLGTGPVSSGGTMSVKVTGRGGVPASGVGAVALNVTAVGPSAGGYLTVYPAGQAAPFASNLNFVAGQTVPNMVIAQVGANGQVSITAAGGPVDVIVDVLGWFPAGNAYASMVPARLMDTRSGPGLATVDGQYLGAGPVASGGTTSVKVTGRGGVPPSGVGAVALNVTAVAPSSGGYLTVYPSGSAVPLASNLNYVAGQTVPNMVIAQVGPDGSVAITGAGGPVNVIVDVMGWFPS